MITMGPLQPDLPSPTAIPRDWELIELDLKDCFYNIFVHETDRPRFAFSVPASNNNKEPFSKISMESAPPGYDQFTHNVSMLCSKDYSFYWQKFSKCLSYSLYE